VSEDTANAVSDEIDASRAPLLDHLIELRRRLLYCIAAIVLAFGVSYWFAEDIFAFLVQPLLTAGQKTLIYTQIFEAFFVKVKVAFFASMMIAFPVIANQLWRFVAPGLYKKEQRALLPFLLATPVLFTAGAAMAYFLAIPMALHFLLSFQGNVGGINQQALPAIGNYLSFVMQFLFGFGLSFLLPVLLMLLERGGIITRKGLIGARRYAIVGATAIAAVLTPPDLMSQVLLAVPLILLYEVAIIGIWFTERRRSRAALSEEAEPA
jgi:sec-independent protein translocase protein TatC